jgi:hypothetical protein
MKTSTISISLVASFRLIKRLQSFRE